MTKKINVSIFPATVTSKRILPGKKIIELISEHVNNPYKYLVARYNNKIVDLHTIIGESGDVELLDINSSEGMEAYRKSASFILCKAFLDVYRNGRIEIVHSLGNNYYYDVYVNIPVDEEVLTTIKNRMLELIEGNDSFLKLKVSRKEAIKIFKNMGLNDKVKLLNSLEKEEVYLYSCGDYCDLAFGPLVPSTGYINVFELRKYEDGLVLSFPDNNNPKYPSQLRHYRKLFNIYKESKNWGRILKINNVGRLNDFIKTGKIYDYIKTAEVLHENKIAKIAEKIVENREKVRLILIAGPSSSGKTTFSKRLAVHLHVNGIDAVPISLDNYFLNRDQTPKDENGEYDFESIYALDLELFNQNLSSLIKGDTVIVPKFDFEKGERKAKGTPMRIAENQMLIVEGIHGLNPILTEAVAAEFKFKIYVSPLTQIALDDFNRIHTTEARLIRRMVRDQKYRAHSAADTLKRWSSVRRGEEKNIFPFQENADVMFNSALVYELAVLKKYAEPLLKTVPENERVYGMAQNLLELLSNFLFLENENSIPPTSILREFIGGSSFNY